MRILIVLSALIALAGCTDVAAEAKNQYLAAVAKHQECIKDNPGVPNNCAGLLRDMEVKEGDYIRLLAGRR